MAHVHKAPYPVIDTDPNFTRVVRYFRPSDYALGAGLTALGPGFIYWMEKYQPSGNPGKPLMRAMKIAASENTREIQKYRVEYRKLKAQGKPMYGPSSLPLNVQRVSAEYSTGAFLNFDVIPWFNVTNHGYHGQSEGVIPEDEK
ncbi:hypothetical protein DL89DRAFT_264292 [Linderina pennispora]|uniref:Uncharacterized protein n=1 Tax=Linderina pennispora TaxID=61395 RepID=A0A1Y1WM22_9FUNG|nr:uncharacterized protein DL89DRAFT_264292 [Linderina pennispora]ORX74415.1 hypothetical protein DL89DRAFT_264292 [Linderina pennispora]